MDLGGLDDLTGLAAVGIDPDGNHWRVAVRAWITPAAYNRHVQFQSLFDDFVEQGDLRVVEPGEDIRDITALAEGALAAGKLRAVGVDPAQAAALVDSLDALDGLLSSPEGDEVPIHGIRQTAYHLSPALRTIEHRAATKEITFADQPIMRWNLNNATIKETGATQQIVREGNRAKIDCCAALLDSATAALAVKEKRVDVAEWII